MNVHAVVPIKPIALGKRRLASVLTPSERRRLIQAMMDHVINTLHQISGFAAIDVLTCDSSLVPENSWHLADTANDLSTAVAIAAQTLQRRRAERMLVLPADLPFLAVQDVSALLEAGRHSQMVIAPNTDRSGTNALLLTLPALVTPQYGADSYMKHISVAHAAGLSVRTVSRPGLEQDIDTPEDLGELSSASLPEFAFLNSVRRRVS